jgi:hypothetical protein
LGGILGKEKERRWNCEKRRNMVERENMKRRKRRRGIGETGGEMIMRTNRSKNLED